MSADQLAEMLHPFRNLLFLTAALFLPLAAYRLLPPRLRRPPLHPCIAGRAGLCLFLLMTASAHFMATERMSLMLPVWVPERTLVIYVTGIVELALAVALFLPNLYRSAGAAIALMLVLFLPANVYAAWNSLPFGGNELGPSYLLVRVPYQLFVVLWCLWATGWIGHGATAKAPTE